LGGEGIAGIGEIRKLERGPHAGSNAFFLGTSPAQYVDSAPHSVGNASLTLNGWRGLYSSLRYRHIGRYLVVNPDNTSVAPAPPYTNSSQAHANGLDVLDFCGDQELRRGLEWNLSSTT